MFNIIKFSIIILMLTWIPGSAQTDIKILQSDAHSITFEWNLTEFGIDEIQSDQDTYQQVSFYNNRRSSEAGQPDIPMRRFTIGVPPGGSAQLQILNSERELIPDINLAPVFYPLRDANNINIPQLAKDNTAYSQDNFKPELIVKLSQVSQFRDIATQEIFLSPIQYNPVTKTLITHKKIVFRLNYNNPEKISRPFRKNGKLDAIYKKLLLNFDIAQNWQSYVPSSLKKPAFLPEGTWYKMTVSEDGLYKIGVGTLVSAGIDISGLSIDNIQMFGGSGHMLTYKTNLEVYNPEHTSEIPIHIRDENQNGLFDANDYLLFYGKGVDSWFYEPLYNSFIFQKHLYAVENYYWLTISSGPGKRMTENNPVPQSNPQHASFYYEKIHFETDTYNLLASGPDWYGRRFYGTSDSYSQTFSITPDLSVAAESYFNIQFKGGSGVKYGDNERYRYYFDVLLNNQLILDDLSFGEHSLVSRNTALTDISSLQSGENSLSIQYSGNLEGCSAHLDWFELNYPHAFTAESDQLNFYTHEYQNPTKYTISGFSNTEDIILFDVTNPVEPEILAKNLTSTDSEVTFDLPEATSPQNLIVSSLSSTAIKSIPILTTVTRRQDLISTQNQADFLIITHKSFLSHAEELASMRTHLTSKVASTEDIYLDFNAGVPDPTAIRNYIRYAYYNWQGEKPSYVLLFGDAHYDYRNISLSDSMRVPSFEIYGATEEVSRVTDNYFVDLNYTSDDRFVYITPDLAVGRIPVESVTDAEHYIQKLKSYESSSVQDGWQTTVTFVADDNLKPGSDTETMHQNQAETMARLPQLEKFIKNKVYLSTFPAVPGGFDIVKPLAAEALIDFLNQGTLIVNYVGHGSPTTWAHEGVFVMNRDLDRISNPGKLPFLIAATCDFGKYDDPHETSFTEALIWKEETGIIGALATTRLVYSWDNALLNTNFYRHLFPGGAPSVALGEAKLLATQSDRNDQKFILFADPTMHLVDPSQQIEITSIPDTLKALSEVSIKAKITDNPSFKGDAVLIINDAAYDSVDTGSGFDLVTLAGPVIFKGKVSIVDGEFTGKFIVPKTIRYVNKNQGRVTLYAISSDGAQSAIGYDNELLLMGSVSDVLDNDGPDIDIYFKDQENFSSGDLIMPNPFLVAELSDEKGINITRSIGNKILLTIDNEVPKDISGFFTYLKDSYKKGIINYPLTDLTSGNHFLALSAFDNLNNGSEQSVEFKISSTSDLSVEEVVNYPNPFHGTTQFTFQTNSQGAEVVIKIYTISGRLIRELNGFSTAGYNDEISWDSRDQDGDKVGNGVYLYKLILKDGNKKSETIEKMVLVR